MARTPKFPKNCCGACYYSHMDGNQLVCFVDPPKAYADELDNILHSRGYGVEPTDPACHLFKGKEHA